MVRWAVEKVYRPVSLAAIAGLLSESRPIRRARSADAARASQLVRVVLDGARPSGPSAGPGHRGAVGRPTALRRQMVPG
jgi:hypothetical protein